MRAHNKAVGRMQFVFPAEMQAFQVDISHINAITSTLYGDYATVVVVFQKRKKKTTSKRQHYSNNENI